MQLLSPAGTILAISTVTDHTGANDVFAITSDNHLWEHTPSGWALLSIGTFRQISAATNKAGGAVVFGVLTDHSLWEYNSLVANGWVMLSPGGTILSVSAVTDVAGNDVAYAITSDARLWQHGPAGWALLSVGAFQQVSAGLSSTGQAEVFAVLTDHSLWENSPSISGGWRMLSPSGTILSVSRPRGRGLRHHLRQPPMGVQRRRLELPVLWLIRVDQRGGEPGRPERCVRRA